MIVSIHALLQLGLSGLKHVYLLSSVVLLLSIRLLLLLLLELLLEHKQWVRGLALLCVGLCLARVLLLDLLEVVVGDSSQIVLVAHLLLVLAENNLALPNFLGELADVELRLLLLLTSILSLLADIFLQQEVRVLQLLELVRLSKPSNVKLVTLGGTSLDLRLVEEVLELVKAPRGALVGLELLREKWVLLPDDSGVLLLVLLRLNRIRNRSGSLFRGKRRDSDYIRRPPPEKRRWW